MSYPMFHPACGRPSAASLADDEFRAEFPAEGLHVEFKQGAPLSAIAETAAAFSNTDGGVILLGVLDDGTAQGIRLGVKSETKVRNALSRVSDLGAYQMHRFDVDGSPVLAIGVSRRRKGFAQLGGGQVKERRGASNATLMGASLADFIARRFTRAAETAPTLSGIDEIDPDLAFQLARAWQWIEPGHDPEAAPAPAHNQDSARAPAAGRVSGSGSSGDAWSGFLPRLTEAGFAVRGDGGDRLSLVGALYLLPDPGRVLGKAYVEVFRYQDEGLDYDRREEFRGPLQKQVNTAVDFILDELGFEWAMLGVTRHELHRLPRVVLREAVANAVAHRSYVAGAAAQPVRIEMRPRRVVVRSPGALPEGVTLENLAHRSVPRNVLAIRTLRFFGIAEDAGRGIRLMDAHMALNVMAPPVFQADESSVTVTLRLGSEAAPSERAWLAGVLTETAEAGRRGIRLHSVGDPGPVLPGVQPRDARLLLRAARGETLVNADARDHLGVGAAEARAALKRLKDRGLLRQEGSGSGTSYTLAASPTGVAGPDGGHRAALPRDPEAEILELAAEGAVTNASARRRTGLERAAVVRILNRLVAEERLVRRGSKRGTHYLLPDHSSHD